MTIKNRTSRFRILIAGATLILLVSHFVSPTAALAASASAINRDATAVLTKLYKNNPGAKSLGDKAVAVLVFLQV